MIIKEVVGTLLREEEDTTKVHCNAIRKLVRVDRKMQRRKVRRFNN